MKHNKSNRHRGFDPDQSSSDAMKELNPSPELRSECEDLMTYIQARVELVDVYTKLFSLTPPDFLDRLKLASKISYKEFDNTFLATMDSAYDQLSLIERKFMKKYEGTQLDREVHCEMIYRHTHGLL